MDENGHNNLDDLEEVFNRHHQRVYTLCLRMTGNVTEAERLTEDVFVQIFRGLQDFPTEAAFSAWLYRLTINRVLMHFRSGVIRKDDGPSSASTECGDGSDKAPTGGASKSRLRKARMKLRQLLTRRMDTTEFDDRIGLDAANSEV
jgi:RNA polymerase sigma factor (sigma-70 family)